MAVDGDVADLVDNQQFCLAVELEPFLDAVLGIGPVRWSTFFRQPPVFFKWFCRS